MNDTETSYLLAQLLNRYGYVIIASPATMRVGEAVKGVTKSDGSVRMFVTGTATFEEYVKQIHSIGKGVDNKVYQTRKLNFYKVVMETK